MASLWAASLSTRARLSWDMAGSTVGVEATKEGRRRRRWWWLKKKQGPATAASCVVRRRNWRSRQARDRRKDALSWTALQNDKEEGRAVVVVLVFIPRLQAAAPMIRSPLVQMTEFTSLTPVRMERAQKRRGRVTQPRLAVGHISFSSATFGIPTPR